MDLRMFIVMLLLRLAPLTMAVIVEKNCIIFEEAYTFDEDHYSGKWYEIRRLQDAQDAENEECVQEKYTRSSNMMDFDIVRAVQMNATEEPTYSTGIASPKVFENAKVPQFYLRYNTTSPAEPDTAIDIVKTDYLNFAIVYSCNSLNSSAVSESAWILSRRPTVSKHAADVINKFVAAHFTHPQHKWRITEQADTFCKPTLITNGGTRSLFNLSFLQTFSHLLVVLLLSRFL